MMFTSLFSDQEVCATGTVVTWNAWRKQGFVLVDDPRPGHVPKKLQIQAEGQQQQQQFATGQRIDFAVGTCRIFTSPSRPPTVFAATRCCPREDHDNRDFAGTIVGVPPPRGFMHFFRKMVVNAGCVAVAIAAPTACDLPFSGQFGSIVFVDRNLFSAETNCTLDAGALCNGARVVLGCVRAQNAYAMTCLVARMVPQVQSSGVQLQDVQVQGGVQKVQAQATTLALADQPLRHKARAVQAARRGPVNSGLVVGGPAVANNNDDKTPTKVYLAIVLSTGRAYSFATLIAQTQSALPFEGQFGSCVFVRFNTVKARVDATTRTVKVGDFLLITRLACGRLGLRALECSVVV